MGEKKEEKKMKYLIKRDEKKKKKCLHGRKIRKKNGLTGFKYGRERKMLWFTKMTTMMALLDDEGRWRQLWIRMGEGRK